MLNTDYRLNLELRVYGSGSYIGSLSRCLKKIGMEYSVNPSQLFEEHHRNFIQSITVQVTIRGRAIPQSISEANAIGVLVAITEPWGQNFSERSRTLIVSLNESDANLAEKVDAFLMK